MIFIARSATILAARINEQFAERAHETAAGSR